MHIRSRLISLFGSILLCTALLVSGGTTPNAHAVSSSKSKAHKRQKSVLMKTNAWNYSLCPRDGNYRFDCEFKTSSKTVRASNGKSIRVNKIRNTYTARCSGIGISISASQSGVGIGAAVSSTEATNYVQNKNRAIVDKAGSVTCNVDPLRAALESWLAVWVTKVFDRYTTGSYTEAWIKGTSDHTSWAWTW